MPRKARITVPGVVHHIMSRGIDDRSIFVDDEDRDRFLDLLGTGIQKSGFQCYAWALMDTHYHLLIRTSEYPLSSLMRWLNSTYSRYYNARYKRNGYLFQDRYRSIATQDQNYIEELVRYIHLNPLRAGVCRTIKDLDLYTWCGHAKIVGNADNAFQNTEVVLKRFDKSPKEAMLKYRMFLELGIKTSQSEDLLKTIRRSNEARTDIHYTGSWVIGDSDFVRQVLSKDKENRSRIAKYRKEGIDLDDVLKKVSDLCKTPREEIKRRSRGGPASEARKVFVYVSNRVYGFKVSDIGRYLGISGPAASLCLGEGEKIAEKDRLLPYF